MRAMARPEYLIVSAGEVVERHRNLAVAERRAEVLSGAEWRDFTVWSDDGQLLAWCREGNVIPTPAVHLTAA